MDKGEADELVRRMPSYVELAVAFALMVIFESATCDVVMSTTSDEMPVAS